MASCSRPYTKTLMTIMTSKMTMIMIQTTNGNGK